MVLIKSVLASIPTYFLSIFKMPVGVANAIEKMQRLFFWGDGVKKKKLHVVNWATVCKSKRLRGLGIGRMEDKNRSLLAKWVWRFGSEEKSLWRRVVCARYGIPNMALVWNWTGLAFVSPFVKAVASLFDKGTAS